jgi:hypothetical protein
MNLSMELSSFYTLWKINEKFKMKVPVTEKATQIPSYEEYSRHKSSSITFNISIQNRAIELLVPLGQLQRKAIYKILRIYVYLQSP